MPISYSEYRQKLETNLSSNPQAFWGHISSLRSGGGFEPKVTYKGDPHSGAGAANAFADFFKSVYLPSDMNSGTQSLLSNKGFCIHPEHYSANDIEMVIKKLKNTKSIGPDGLPTIFVKHCAELLTIPLSHIMNLIVQSSMYPSQWKTTKVIPIPKSQDKVTVEDFGPIAILAKIFESL
jgi:hypothetical protein